jgi:hypothetical protein
MKREEELTAEIARKLIAYDPDTGVLTWLPREREWFKTDRSWKGWNVQFSGKQAGYAGTKGYIYVCILEKPYRAHRVAWLLMTGSWPENEIDHINHDRADNRFVNLRDVPHLDNHRNMSIRVASASGVTGVYWHKTFRKWHAYIKVNGRGLHLGSFSEKHDAISARKAAEIEHSYHPNHGAAS